MAVAAMVIVMLNWVATAEGVNVRDISHLQGTRENELIGVSLVVGLNGTGDGKSVQTVRSLAHMLQQLGHTGVTLDGIDTQNVAMVLVTATIPSSGARGGTQVDVKVSSVNGAKSLKGGRLVQCQMRGPMATGDVYALSSGDVVLDDPANPTTGIIKGGCVMEEDVTVQVVAKGRITIVLDGDHATWAIASSIARIINDAEAEPGLPLAIASGPEQVVVRVPTAELGAPADFIARVLDLPVLMPDLQARIVINRRSGTIVITGDVEIDPVTFTQRGLTIQTIDPKMPPTLQNPDVRLEQYQIFDPKQQARRTTVRQLTDAFNQLQVPIEDQISIIWAIKRAGHLHAAVVEQ